MTDVFGAVNGFNRAFPRVASGLMIAAIGRPISDQISLPCVVS
jgi:hypothetical protein